MSGFILRRLAQSAVTLVSVSVVVFAMMRLLPGDLVAAIMGDAPLYVAQNQQGAQQERLVFTAAAEALREHYHLDKPFHEQYAIWLANAVQGDFGVSAYNQQPVFLNITGAFPVTLEIVFLAVIISNCISFPVGILSAVRQDTWMDYVFRILSIAALSVHAFFTGVVLLLVLSIYWRYSPPIYSQTLLDNPLGHLQQVIFPALVVGAILAGTQARMIRSSLLEVVRIDYIRTARAKGLTGRAVIWGHALKNAMIPVLSLMGVQIANLIGSAVIVEVIFAVPGLGRLTLDAIQRRDYPQLEANILFYAFVLLLLNLLVDLLYAYFDPRIRFAGGA